MIILILIVILIIIMTMIISIIIIMGGIAQWLRHLAGRDCPMAETSSREGLPNG